MQNSVSSVIVAGKTSKLPTGHMYVPFSSSLGGEEIFCNHPTDGKKMTKAFARGNVYSKKDPACKNCKKCRIGKVPIAS